MLVNALYETHLHPDADVATTARTGLTNVLATVIIASQSQPKYNSRRNVRTNMQLGAARNLLARVVLCSDISILDVDVCFYLGFVDCMVIAYKTTKCCLTILAQSGSEYKIYRSRLGFSPVQLSKYYVQQQTS